MNIRFLASLFSLSLLLAGPVACGGDDESTPSGSDAQVDVGEFPDGADAVPGEDDGQVDVGELPGEDAPVADDVAVSEDVDEPALDVSDDVVVPEDVDEPAVDVAEDVDDGRMDVADAGQVDTGGADADRLDAGMDVAGADIVDVGPDAGDVPVDAGRIVSSRAGLIGIFMALGNPDLVQGAGAQMQEVRQLIRQSVRWVSTTDEPSVLYLRGEFVEPADQLDPDDPIVADWRTVTRTLRGTFDRVDIMEAPAAEQFDRDLLEGYDVIWFAAPLTPNVQRRTVEILTDYYREGVGLVLQGEDSIPRYFDDLMRVEATSRFRRNPCNRQLGPELGNAYSVQFTDQPNPAIEGLRGESFGYAGPIREVERTSSGEQVLAYANLPLEGDCSYEVPAVVAVEPDGGGE
jgi:hypothetical protein